MNTIENTTGKYRFYITDKSWYSGSWLLLGLLLALGIVTWLAGYTMLALVIAAFGLITVVAKHTKGKQNIGNYIEIQENNLLFSESAQTVTIPYENINLIKYVKLKIWQEPVCLVQTKDGKEKNIQPSYYENHETLREQLNKTCESHQIQVE